MHRPGYVWDVRSKSKGDGGGLMCLVAERRESRTSRRDNSSARAVSERVAGFVSEAKVEKDRFFEDGEVTRLLTPRGVGDAVEEGLRMEGSLMTPVDCQFA
jgi:hypothetical protein